MDSPFPYYEPAIPEDATASYSLEEDAALYGADRGIPVARFASENFLHDKSVIVPVMFSGEWALVLTPSRQQLPSSVAGGAPAQTAGWIRRDLLTKAETLTDHVVVSVSAQTVSIVDSDGSTVQKFDAGVGAPDTPTPTGVVGYLQARYLDPAQNETVHPINLTSLHSAAADEPFGGNDGGLIGIHYQAQSTGEISHGCVRLNAAAIKKINKLPLGTLVEMKA